MNGRPDPSRPVATSNDLIGSLQVVALLDFCQFLLLNRKTGTLTLFHRSGVSRLFFVGGEIVNALDESQGREGHEVALSLFRIREGGFRFRQEDVHEKRRIEGTTENLLLDAARKMDEIGEALPGVGGGEVSHEKGMREKQEKGEALRRLFSSLEEDLTRSPELPGLSSLLRSAEEAGADTVILETEKPPVLLRANRVVRALPGVVRPDDLSSYARGLEGKETIGSGSGAYRSHLRPEEGRIVLRRVVRSASLADARVSPACVEAILHRPSGIVLLVAETPPARGLLFDGILRLLGERGEAVVTFGEKPLEQGKGLFVSLGADRSDPIAPRRLRDFLTTLPTARVALGEVRGREDATLLLDLARGGHLCVAALPGWEGGDALRKAASWFREDGTLQAIATHLAGIVALQLHPASGERFVPVTSCAPVGAEARLALEREDFASFSGSLEKTAGEDGFAGSLRRLVDDRQMEKSEADRIASLLSELVMGSATPPPPPAPCEARSSAPRSFRTAGSNP